ncbi:hypothetical protein PIB30_080623 [Stylosanthes scabra]|uniref:Uncharacterized protein n=1 Tax=Stylosanthes scabra TaxID=79078 RepID=A0ABU6SRX4_9FABA|nr:hypothetical protein [Stylosanthes scabra]
MGEFVSGVATVLLDKLATKTYQEIVLACGLKGEVAKFQSKMNLISSYIMDAEEKQTKKGSIVVWLKQLRDIFDDADDILEEIEYEAKRKEVVKMYGSTFSKVRRFFSFSSNPLRFRIKIAHKIRDVKQRIDEKIIEGTNLGIATGHYVNASIPEKDSSWRETVSFVPKRVTGRIEEKQNLIDLMVRSETPSESESHQGNNIDVIPIFGIGGLGKTTLAQMAYSDALVKNHFDMQMWVFVSDDGGDFDVRRLIYQIVKAASAGYTRVDQTSSLDQLLSSLKEILHEKRFLLVLDDIWNEESMKWEVLRGGEVEQYSRLKKIGEAILKKCKGVPLAITTLGCLLKSKPCDEYEWKQIRDSEIWELDAKDDAILPSLKLSYNHLPQRLKQCFSLCSLYPKDCTYSTPQLIMLWMAHGLLQPTTEEKEPEQIGQSYIKKLLSSSFLQFPDDIITDNEVLPVLLGIGLYELKMHDLIHDLAKSTMKESNTIQTIIASQKPQGSSMEWTSHESKHLKVLDLEHTELELLPDDCFSKVKQLRCLRLSNCDMPEKLPGSICKLQLLQCLDLSDCRNLEELPETMKNLISLRYLFLTLNATSLSFMDTGNFQQLQCLFIVSCENLVSLPSALGHLTALKKLMIGGCAELANFDDDEDEDRKQHVHDLKLEFFSISESPKLKALPRWLKRSIKALRYMGIADIGIEALPEWLSGATSLELLGIENCPELASLPDNMEQLHNLSHLYIIECPEIAERCDEDTGPDWPKIAHIPHRQAWFDKAFTFRK